MKKRIVISSLCASLFIVSVAAGCAVSAEDEMSGPIENPGWRQILQYFRNDDSVNQVILVKYIGGNDAEVQMYVKDKECKNAWTKELVCDGLVGKTGAGYKTGEGDPTTPFGIYSVTTAFGIKENPGTTLPYVDVIETTYCCDEDTEYYNTIIDTAETGHDCHGEEMYKYSPEYNYGMFLDFNKECVPKGGSAIFFHCDGARDYTGGCVAVSEENMKTILETCDSGVKVCIFDKVETPKS